MLVIGADAELVRPLEVFLAGHPPRRIVNPNIVQQESGVGPLVVPADVGAARDTIKHYGDAVQFFVSRVKNVPAQLVTLEASVALQYWSNAFMRSLATASGPRPSIWCRWMNATTSPSLNNAIDGELGW